MDDRKIVTVTRLAEYVKNIFEYNKALKNFYIRGEISGFKQSGGHYYFALKDDECQVDCMIFSSYARKLNFKPENGHEVIAQCQANFYAKTSRFSLIVKNLEAVGEGYLYAEFERLKLALSKEGLFAVDRKKALPVLPQRVAIITSATGAVIHDILHVLEKRFPYYNLLLLPAIVQGKYSVDTIINQLNIAEKRADIDVIVIARGGGSIEDLWSFNEERLARAIYACTKVVVSAVGHETDYTICDFVADHRAATPSAAASLIYPDYLGIINYINNQGINLDRYLENKILNIRREFDYLQDGIKSSFNIKIAKYEERRQNFEYLIEKIQAKRINDIKIKLMSFNQDLNHKIINFNNKHLKFITNICTDIRNELLKKLIDLNHKLDSKIIALNTSMKLLHINKLNKLNYYISILEASNPDCILDRGYAYIVNENNKPITSIQTVNKNDLINMKLKDGIIKSKVLAIEKIDE